MMRVSPIFDSSLRTAQLNVERGWIGVLDRGGLRSCGMTATLCENIL
jgi:hypothetical protein